MRTHFILYACRGDGDWYTWQPREALKLLTTIEEWATKFVDNWYKLEEAKNFEFKLITERGQVFSATKEFREAATIAWVNARGTIPEHLFFNREFAASLIQRRDLEELQRGAQE